MRIMIALAALAALAACAPADDRAERERAAAAEAAGEAEPHDRSAFATDPAQMHVRSPDEPDMHPDPAP